MRLLAFACAACVALAASCGAPPASPPAPVTACDEDVKGVLATAFRQCACGDEATCIAKCDGGSAAACEAAGSCYMWGLRTELEPIFPPDAEKAFRYSKRACELGRAMACGNLGELYRGGLGTPQNETLAEDAYARALASHRADCNAGKAGACYLLSNAYASGKGVPKDDAQARLFLERACSLGHGFACAFVSIRVARSGDRAAAAAWLGKACEQSCGVACYADAEDPRLRELYGDAGVRAVKDWRARCDRGEAKRCTRASHE
jgi:TPR repeat protein